MVGYSWILEVAAAYELARRRITHLSALPVGNEEPAIRQNDPGDDFSSLCFPRALSNEAAKHVGHGVVSSLINSRGLGRTELGHSLMFLRYVRDPTFPLYTLLELCQMKPPNASATV